MATLYERRQEPTAAAVYNIHPYPGQGRPIKEVEPIDCQPRYCYTLHAFLKWLEFLLLFTLFFLVQVVCGGAMGDCTMIMNRFGTRAHGQMYVMIVLILLLISTTVIMIAYSVNLHNARLSALRSLEKAHTVLAIILLIPAAIIGSYYASKTTDPYFNNMGRSDSGIRPQWIAAACFEWISVLVFLGDLILQLTPGYPTSVTWT